MKGRSYIGIDNGVSGTIGIITIAGRNLSFFHKIPVFRQLDYVKRKRHIHRVDTKVLESLLKPFENAQIMIERPMVNPHRFRASVSAIRALEATLIVVESLGFPYQYVDSRDWQKVLLPRGCGGKELKHASRDIGLRLFPDYHEQIRDHGDADGLLIAEYCRRKMG